MGEGIRIHFERRHSSFGVRSVNINKASCRARLFTFRRNCTSQKGFFPFFDEICVRSYEEDHSIENCIGYVHLYFYLYTCMPSWTSNIAVILVIVINILLLSSIIAISLTQWLYISIYDTILFNSFFLLRYFYTHIIW